MVFIPANGKEFLKSLDFSKVRGAKVFLLCQWGKFWLATRIRSCLLEQNSRAIKGADFFGRDDAKAETPVLRPPHAKSWLIGKDLDAGRDWGQEEKGTTEDEMSGWHYWLDGRESEWTSEVGDG